MKVSKKKIPQKQQRDKNNPPFRKYTENVECGWVEVLGGEIKSRETLFINS